MLHCRTEGVPISLTLLSILAVAGGLFGLPGSEPRDEEEAFVRHITLRLYDVNCDKFYSSRDTSYSTDSRWEVFTVSRTD